MHPLAAWLIGRPQNAVIGLAATLAMPVLHVFSGIFLVLLVLAQGERLAAIEAAIAGVIVAALVAVVGGPLLQVPLDALFVWIPALGLGAALRATRSLTLTLQISALLVTGAAVWMFGIDGDVVAITKPLTSIWLEMMRSNDMREQADTLAADPESLATFAGILLLWTRWMLCVVSVTFGYRWYRLTVREPREFGRFSQLDFGRVIAVIMGVTSVVAFLSSAGWLQNIAVVMLAVFWLQGLALVHWLYESGKLPLFALIMVYVLFFMPVLNVLLIVGLAIVGYSDAWFHFRPRVTRVH